MLENLDWGSILSIVFAVLTSVLGGFWLKAKGKLGQLKNVAQEGYEALKVTIESFDDDKLDPAEIAAIKKESLEAWEAIKVLLNIKPKE